MFKEKNEAQIEFGFEKETPEEKLERSGSAVKKELDAIESGLGNLFFDVEEKIEEKRKETEMARAEGKPVSEVEKIYNRYLRFSNIHDMLWRRFDLLHQEQFIDRFDEYAALRKETQALQSPALRDLGGQAEKKGTGTREFSWPIVRGEIFRPRRELHDIKSFPRSEKKQKLEEFKEKLAYQKEGLAEMQEIMMLKIRENPDVSKEELMKEAEYFADEFGFNEWQRTVAETVIDAYLQKHKSVRENRAAYPDDKDIFRKVFGKMPEGKIEVIEGPITLYFRCYDIRDFSGIRGGKFYFGEKITDEDIIKNKTIKGVTAYSLVKDLVGTIIVENFSKPADDSAETLVHEEEHILQELFAGVVEETEKEFDFFTAFLEAQSKEQKEILFARYFRSLLKESEKRAQGEILAYFKEKDVSAEKIFERLIEPEEEGGAYDYRYRLKTELNEWINEKEFKPFADKAFNEVFEIEYPNLLIAAIEAFENLKKYYNTEKAVEILRNEPLANWKKAAMRLCKANRWPYEKWLPHLGS